MEIVVLKEVQRADFEGFRRMFQRSCGAVHRRRKDEHGGDDESRRQRNALVDRRDDVLDRLVCVTSGGSYLGIAIVKELLAYGYSVRIIVGDEEDVNKLRDEVELGEIRLNNNLVEVVLAKLTEVESITEAFHGCCGVFHTAAFVDPAGISGYSKAMVDVEVNATNNVVRACAASPSVKCCVLTSSLLACVWRDNSVHEAPCVINHNSWSDESICINKKLWYALGKLKAEKAAWEIAKETSLNLATICPGLVTGPGFLQRSPTPTRAYLKGIQQMYANGVLATVDINRLAKAHIHILKEMKVKDSALGRYICFDKVIKEEYNVVKLAHETGIEASVTRRVSSFGNRPQYALSSAKLTRLMLSTPRVAMNIEVL